RQATPSKILGATMSRAGGRGIVAGTLANSSKCPVRPQGNRCEPEQEPRQQQRLPTCFQNLGLLASWNRGGHGDGFSTMGRHPLHFPKKSHAWHFSVATTIVITLVGTVPVETAIPPGHHSPKGVLP